jgi:hypothetical protein
LVAAVAVAVAVFNSNRFGKLQEIIEVAFKGIEKFNGNAFEINDCYCH